MWGYGKKILEKKEKKRGYLTAAAMTSMCLCPLEGNLVLTGVVWEGVRGILLDTETVECNMRRDIFEKKKKKR